MKTLFTSFLIVTALMSVTCFADTVHGNVPPGLQNKAMPHGLQMQNKTPNGWNKGEKEGWEKNRHDNNGFRKDGDRQQREHFERRRYEEHQRHDNDQRPGNHEEHNGGNGNSNNQNNNR